MVNTNMTHVFKHPKFYRIPRDKSDQTISDVAATARTERASGPGLKLPGPRPISNANKGLIHKRQAQATSGKPQASSFKRQATSIPTRVTSVKLQATSCKLPDPRTMVHGYWRSFRGARTKGLC